MDLTSAIKERRSIRKYKTDPIPDNLIEQILDSARWAPSWANTQCVKFIVIKDAEMKQKLQNTLSPTNPARNAMLQAPVIIAAFAETNKAGYKKGEPVTDKNEWFMFDTALSLHNITLTAYSLGLGTVHVGFFKAKEVRALLNIPEDMAVVELMPLGYPDETPIAPQRKPLNEIVFYEKWNNKQGV